MSELNAIETLRRKGFDRSFTAEENGLRCTQTGELFAPEHVTIVQVYRFEGTSNVSDEAVVYGLETDSGERGVISDAYGPYASPELAALLDRMKMHRDA